MILVCVIDLSSQGSYRLRKRHCALEMALKVNGRSVIILLVSVCLPTITSSAQTFGTNPKPHLMFAPDLFMTFQVLFSLLS